MSVYMKDTRTSNAIEAYNGAIGKRFPAKGNFFRFALILLQEEFSKAKDFADLVQTGGASSENKKRKYSVRILRVFLIAVPLY